MDRRGWVPFLILCAGALALWPLRGALTAEGIAARSPRQAWLAAAFLLALYAVKSLSVAFPLSALEAAGGMLFPLPTALAVNACGVAVAQAVPYLLGRRQRGGLGALRERFPALAALAPPAENGAGRAVFLLRLGGASPGDLVSMYLGAAGVPWRAYFVGGLLGSLPRAASATLLGTALWEIGGDRFWLSLGAGGLLTAVSLVLWRAWRRG